MLKNILKLNGAQQLSKNELQSINGGRTWQFNIHVFCMANPNHPNCLANGCESDDDCGSGVCNGNYCFYGNIK